MVPAASTWPTPLSISIEVAPVTFHSKVADPPVFISVGLAAKATMFGAACGVVQHKPRNSENPRSRLNLFIFAIPTNDNLARILYTFCQKCEMDLDINRQR